MLEQNGVITREDDPTPLFENVTATGVCSSSTTLRALN
jgi:hypothetical protein